MAEDQLRKAFNLMKQGKKQDAARICQAVIKQNRDNIQAWWLMANLLDDPDKRDKAAQRVLQLNPNHAGARKMLGMEPPALTQSKPRREKQIDYSDPEPRGPKPIEELDFSKLEALESKSKKENAPSEDQVVRLATMAGVGLVIIVILVAVGVVVWPMIQVTPDEVVSEFITLTFDRDIAAANNLVCAEQRLSAEEIPEIEAQFAQTLGINDVVLDYSGLTYEVTEQSGDSAQVAVRGSISYTATVGDTEETVSLSIPETGILGEDNRLTLIREEGDWRICEPIE